MRDVWAESYVVFAEELRRNVRRRAYQVVVMLVPLLLLIAFAIVPPIKALTSGHHATTTTVGYFDESGSLGPIDVQGFQKVASTDAGIQAVAQGTLHDFFVVPADYLTTGTVDWYTSSSGVIADQNLQTRISNILRAALVSGKLPGDVAQRVLAGSAFTWMHVSTTGKVTPGGTDIQRFILPGILALLLIVSAFIGSGTLLQTVSDEKENRAIEVLLTSVSPLSVMTGKILALGLSTLIQVVAWAGSLLLIGPRIFSQIPALSEITIDPLVLTWAFLFFLAGYLLFSSILAAIGSATTSSREAGQIAAIIIVPAVIPFYLVSVILQSPSGLLAVVLSFIPVSAPTTMMLRLGTPSLPAWEAALSLLETAAFAALAVFLAARVFRAGLLMYGQRMTPRGVWRALRSAG